MACEMCGNSKVAAIVKVEGVEMEVCEKCTSHGALVRRIAEPAPRRPKTTAPLPGRVDRKPSEELVETIRPDLPRILREHRERLKLDQEKFAAKLGIKASTYHHYENGSAKPDIPTARKIEHELKMPIVGHIKVSSQATMTARDERGMQLSDFIRKR